MTAIVESHFRNHLRNNPNDGLVRFGLAEYYFQTRRWDALHRIVEESARMDVIPLADRGRIVMLEFLSYYLRGKMNESPKYFGLANHLNDGMKINPDLYGNMHIFFLYMLRLLQYRNERASLYEGEASKTLHLIGDSHVLGAHQMVISGVKCQSHLVIGCKAFHVKEWADNQYYGYLKGSLDKLSPKSDVLIVLGEIDCRVDGGIVPYAIKSGEDMKAVAEKTAKEYVECLSKGGHNVSFMTVPPLSPQRVVNSAKLEEHRGLIMLVRDAIEYFNEALRSACATHGCGVVDVYQEAIGDNRIARADAHIDNIHLKPHVVRAALERATGS